MTACWPPHAREHANDIRRMPLSARWRPWAVVIGGSAGSLPVLKTVLGELPAHWQVPVVIVVHLPEHAGDGLVQVLGAGCALPVQQAEDKQQLHAGRVYLAPPGYHLLMEHPRALALSVDAPVHHSRPAIDVLFESASAACGSALAGMLLSGASADGAAGLEQIHRAGGLTLVQAPQSASSPQMPRAALQRFHPVQVCEPAQLAVALRTCCDDRHGPLEREEKHP